MDSLVCGGEGLTGPSHRARCDGVPEACCPWFPLDRWFLQRALAPSQGSLCARPAHRVQQREGKRRIDREEVKERERERTGRKEK